MNNIKRSVISVLLLFVCLFLSGCVEFDYKLDIKPDGSGKVTYKVITYPMMAPKLEGLIEGIEKDGYKVEVQKKADKINVIGTKIFPEGKWMLPYVQEAASNYKCVPKYTNLLFVRFYSLDMSYTCDKEKIEKVLGKGYPGKYNIIPINYTVNVPGFITSCNASESSNGKCSWNTKIAPGEIVNIQLKSFSINYLFCIIAIVLIAGTIYFIKKK